ncbi:acyltransferase family protein [Streptomyces sp. NPDC003943]
MRRGFALPWSHGTVAELFTGRDNSLGFLRLGLATAVVVSHARILGYGGEEHLLGFSHGQLTLGTIAVYGFFVLSGILVSRSGARLPIGRYFWHRVLRILPGVWVCLLVTAFGVAPYLYWRTYGSLEGFNGPKGPVDYLRSNWSLAMRQYDISGLLGHLQSTGTLHNGAFDGALWSLRYEFLCYIGVAVLAVTGVLTRARRAIVLITALLLWLIARQALSTPFWGGPGKARYFEAIDLPLLGFVTPAFIIYLGFAFCLGVLIEVYRDRIPVSDWLGVTAVAVLAGSLHYGYFFVAGIPALAYTLLWLAIRLPAPFRRIGARNDYSYGIYIYGFVVQQTLAVLGWTRWGMSAYLAITMVLTLLCAALSWHLVERPALRLKDLGRRRPPEARGRTVVAKPAAERAEPVAAGR